MKSIFTSKFNALKKTTLKTKVLPSNGKNAEALKFKTNIKRNHGRGSNFWHFYVQIFDLEGLQVWSGLEVWDKAEFPSIDHSRGIYPIRRSNIWRKKCQKEDRENRKLVITDQVSKLRICWFAISESSFSRCWLH